MAEEKIAFVTYVDDKGAEIKARVTKQAGRVLNLTYEVDGAKKVKLGVKHANDLEERPRGPDDFATNYWF